jgi:hypothetical protein
MRAFCFLARAFLGIFAIVGVVCLCLAVASIAWSKCGAYNSFYTRAACALPTQGTLLVVTVYLDLF